MIENPPSESDINCFTCQREYSKMSAWKGYKPFHDIRDCGTDSVSHLEKLKTCVPLEDWIEPVEMGICCVCLKSLRISYNFRKTVIKTQEKLRVSLSVTMPNTLNCSDPVKTESFNSYREKEEVDDKGESSSDESNSDTKFSSGGGQRYVEGGGNENYDSSSTSDTSAEVQKKIIAKKKRKKKENIDLVLHCSLCQSKFNKNWKLTKHIARVHDRTRRYLCTLCNKEFKQSYHLKEHMTSHTGEKNYTCTLCEKDFQRVSSLRRHIRSHSKAPGEKTKKTPFLCPICGKSFPFSNGVQRHMRIHLGVRGHQCSVCLRKFAQSTHLQVHMRTHTGEKPFICETCGEKFSLKSCMLKHINNYHYKSESSTQYKDEPNFQYKSEDILDYKRDCLDQSLFYNLEREYDKEGLSHIKDSFFETEKMLFM